MDISNIIRRLQDVDKLKMVFLDENQRKVFDLLPKPGIGKSTRNNTFMTLESITKSKKSRLGSRKSYKKFGFLLNGDPFNQRMFDMIDPNMRVFLEQNNNEGNEYNK